MDNPRKRDPSNRGPSKRGATDRSRVAADQGYELRYFARKHGLTTAQANDLIRRIGNDRAKLNEAAVRLRRSVVVKDTPPHQSPAR